MADAKPLHSAKKTKSKKGAEAEVVTGPIYYADFINMTEVAAILIDKMAKLMITSPEMAFNHATEEQLDPIKFGIELDSLVEPEMVHELMSSELAQGILLGMYLAHSEQEAINKQLEEEEMAGRGDEY